MSVSDQIRQRPAPGRRQLMFQGDVVTFFLELERPDRGGAWLRTNIGHGHITRQEIIRRVHFGEPALGRDWFDLPMTRVDERHFRLTLPLCEVGHFEAKCFFLPVVAADPIWPPGPNTTINVEPADTFCGNTIYNAFIRQFGPNKLGRRIDEFHEHAISGLDREGYAVIPPSGKFRDLIEELDFIMGELGCRIIHLLPIFPTPTTYGRMGRFGSPYAALSFTAVDPALAVFDPKATPLEQFIELVDAVHQRCGKVMIDIAINHTGWAASLHETHPNWLIRDSEGRIEVPGAWGIWWEDLTRLDYSDEGLWRYMARVFLTWCRRGVDGFRCDAGYMIPAAAWEYIISRVRSQYPDTIFFLEGLGGKIVVTRDLLNRADFNWGYSELFQNYDRQHVEAYLAEAFEISESDGALIHFAETHDNPRLAARSTRYSQMRTALCALCSLQGGFGFANGVEWFATEKIDVHDAPSLNWGAPENQVDFIGRINRLLCDHPAFHHPVDLKFIPRGEGNFIALLRRHRRSGRELLVLVNLDDHNEVTCGWEKRSGWELSALDLLSGQTIRFQAGQDRCFCQLGPAGVLCLSNTPEDLKIIKAPKTMFKGLPKAVQRQRQRSKALEVISFYQGLADLEGIDIDAAARELGENPVAFCRSWNHVSEESRVVVWQWPVDARREVMLPPDHFLLIRADIAFRTKLVHGRQTIGQEDSIEKPDGSYFALFRPMPVPLAQKRLILQVSAFLPGHGEHVEAPLLLLPHAENVGVPMVFGRDDPDGQPTVMLGTNGCGAMMRSGKHWGLLYSHYDALLAANLNPDFPEDRHVMLARCRAWLVFQGYSQTINQDCLEDFRHDYDSTGYWRYLVPSGQGQHVELTIAAGMVPGSNSICLTFTRHPARGRKDLLPDSQGVRLVLRPDIEDRNFHHITKAYQGPEHQWPGAVHCRNDGFSFRPHPDRTLDLKITSGSFHPEPEWQYMVSRPAEVERGRDPNSDLFSPGYFSCELAGDTTVVLIARVVGPADKSGKDHCPEIRSGKISARQETALPFDEALKRAMGHYVVRRGELKSVIAGYPWFLDWGRDSLIFSRGLISARRMDDARAVLKQFGMFETDGTLPNMIRGGDAGNRDTSDAPLWFVAACADLVAAEGDEGFLKHLWSGRSIREILLSIGESYIRGTPNGIRMDDDSGLVFSPSHFTWMDTNHPAGTPREGYPIEIQALWFAALRFFSRIGGKRNGRKWELLAEKVRSSIHDLFFMADEGYLSDCLHARAGTPARRGEVDDALRPNQLLAVTMGAVSDPVIGRKVVNSCETLVVPGAIRSLADQRVRRPLEIVRDGNLLSDPYHPYRGEYVGDEDSRRKPAYHNGTAWTWLFPSFCEAWAQVYGRKGIPTAKAILASGVRWIGLGCVGHLPEILDGNYPHTPRGCDAQAWGVSEAVRVWEKLSSAEGPSDSPV